MALEGNVNSFGISEILQLIAVQQKTGMLTLSSAINNAVLFFRSGQLISARDRRRRARDPFKDYLTRYGILGREDLVRISQIGSQSKLDLIDILLSEEFMSEEMLQYHWRKQVQEAVHEVLTWDECNYKFIASDEIINGIKSPADFSVEAILMESMRRIDEFPQMLKMFPHDRLRVSTTGEEPADPDEMTRNSVSILEKIKGVVTLADLIATGQLPMFEVYEALKLLKEKGLVKVEETAARETTGKVTTKRSRRKVGNLFPLVVAVVIFASASFLGFKSAVLHVSNVAKRGSSAIKYSEPARDRLEYKLRWLIEAHRAEYGVYPESLEQLVGAGIAPSPIIEKARSLDLRYRLTPGRPGYTLM